MLRPTLLTIMLSVIMLKVVEPVSGH